ncbi:MAG: hypothetical protein JKY56_00450 [Kofleriaceae bacterium]|nr:hypothetical protein [Kofleriaceae bacterium]
MRHSIHLSILIAIVVVLGLSGSATAQVRGPARVKPVEAQAAARRTAVQRARPSATTRPSNRAKPTGLKAIYRTVKDNFHIYKGDKIEGWINRMKVGRSDFNSKQTVQKNLKELAKTKGMEHYYAKIDGRDVLHIVVDLGSGKPTKDAMRNILRRVGNETVELNYKASSSSNPYGHVAVRVGNGAFYDLTGTRGVSKLPKFMERTLSFLGKSPNLTFARKRNMRTFMETRNDSPTGTAYYGLLFAASATEVKQTQSLYNQRLKDATSFNVSGGDAKKGEFSCAQFLTENVPFFNSRGVGASVGAKTTTTAAQKSLQLEAVVVYKSASIPTASVQQFP